MTSLNYMTRQEPGVNLQPARQLMLPACDTESPVLSGRRSFPLRDPPSDVEGEYAMAMVMALKDSVTCAGVSP